MLRKGFCNNNLQFVFARFARKYCTRKQIEKFYTRRFLKEYRVIQHKLIISGIYSILVRPRPIFWFICVCHLVFQWRGEGLASSYFSPESRIFTGSRRGTPTIMPRPCPSGSKKLSIVAFYMRYCLFLYQQ